MGHTVFVNNLLTCGAEIATIYYEAKIESTNRQMKNGGEDGKCICDGSSIDSA